MRITKLQLYKLVEFDKGFAILHQHDNLGGRQDVVPLIVSGMSTITEYLNRYVEYRARGLGLKESHARALAGANVVESGSLDPSDYIPFG